MSEGVSFRASYRMAYFKKLSLRFTRLSTRTAMGRFGRLFSAKNILVLLLIVCVFNVGRYMAPCSVENNKLDLDGVHLNRHLRMDKVQHQAEPRKSQGSAKEKNNVISDSKPAISKSKPPNDVQKARIDGSDAAFHDKVRSARRVKPLEPAPVQSQKVTSKPALKGQSPKASSKPNTQPKAYVAKDYYGTGTSAHHDALRKMGAESVSKHSFKSPFIIDPHIYSRSTIRKPPGNRKLKVISCFNCPERFYTSHKYNNDFQQCPYSECRLTTSAGMNPDADVMIFWQDPEIHPPPKPKHQAWIYMSWETPPHRSYPKPENLWLDKINWTISYRINADFMLPYDYMYWRDQALLKPDSFYLEMAKRKNKMATWWVSHCETRSHREQYVRELQKYIDVDVYGACGNLTCDRELSSQCYRNLNDSYRFYLSFENSFCLDYVTEKFFKMFRHRFNIIPVVRSSFDFEKYLPPNILVNADKFASPKELAVHLKALAGDHVRYAMMLKEKDKLGILNRKIDWCDFCEKLHTGKFKNKVIHSVKEFSSEGGRCWDKVIKS